MATTKAIINPDIVPWGRERQELTVGALAAKLSVKENLVAAWESGESAPTFPQARRLARTLRIPFGYLYLSEVPSIDLPLPDLRTLPGTDPAAPSADLLDVPSEVLLKQQWYRDHIEAEEALPLPFLGKFTSSDSVEDIAADIQATCEIDAGMRQKSHSWSDFLTQFVRKVESNRILVMRSGVVGNNGTRKLDVDEFRGFVVSDELAPVIFINTRDAVAARIFTLAHELAHLWIGVSGISRSAFDLPPDQDPPEDIESHCDMVAAAVLMPKGDFKTRWQTQLDAIDNVQRLAAYYRVSALAVLRQAREQDMLDDSAYFMALSDAISKQTSVAGGAGGDFYNNFLARNGSLFASTLLTAVLNEQVSFREAGQLLAVNPSTVRGAARHIYGAGVV